ncbi:MAG: radical SAM protein [Eubacteriales bacterium]|nr:radical SAM protein [Eubacteriales bacterium]
MNCNLCPRSCNVDRNVKTGFCMMNNEIRAARAALHMWEEPCISRNNGSGTVFFTGCTLRCVFCQNYKIASEMEGKTITTDRLTDIFLELQDKKANNINLVTPTHFVNPIIKALENAKSKGLVIPVVYNTSGYEKVETLRMLDGLVDVYLPDFKYVSSELSLKYSGAVDYFQVAKDALKEMVRQRGNASFYNHNDILVKEGFVEEGIMKSGVVVRHLILPGNTEDSKKVVEYLYKTYKDDIFISIMNQYTPLPQVKDIPELNRKVTEKEYDEVIDYALELGVTNGFIQEGETSEESFIPEFDFSGIL